MIRAVLRTLHMIDMPPTFLLQTGPKKCGKIITNVEKIDW